MKNREYNFIWIGLITTKEKMNEQEEKQAKEVLAKKNCYPVFITLDELEPYT